VELRVAGSAVFSVAGLPQFGLRSPSVRRRALRSQGSEVEGQVRWQVSTAALTPRQSLTRIGSADWTNGYINAYDVQGVASQGEINNLQAELNATQAGAGLGSDGTYTERTSATTSTAQRASTALTRCSTAPSRARPPRAPLPTPRFRATSTARHRRAPPLTRRFRATSTPRLQRAPLLIPLCRTS
jgi:hypothetical protein